MCMTFKGTLFYFRAEFEEIIASLVQRFEVTIGALLAKSGMCNWLC